MHKSQIEEEKPERGDEPPRSLPCEYDEAPQGHSQTRLIGDRRTFCVIGATPESRSLDMTRRGGARIHLGFISEAGGSAVGQLRVNGCNTRSSLHATDAGRGVGCQLRCNMQLRGPLRSLPRCEMEGLMGLQSARAAVSMASAVTLASVWLSGPSGGDASFVRPSVCEDFGVRGLSKFGEKLGKCDQSGSKMAASPQRPDANGGDG